MKDIRRPDFINAAMTSRSHSSIREMFMAVLIFFVGSLAGSLIQIPAMVVYFLNNMEYINMIRSGNITSEKILEMMRSMPDWTVVVTLCAGVGILIVSIIYCKMIEKRKAYSMGFSKKSFLKSYFAGIGLGGLMVFLLFASCALSGSIQIDFTITGQKNIPVILLFLAGYLIEGMAEEALCRGFLLVSLTKRYTVFVSLLLSSIFYAFFCGLNSDISGMMYFNLVLFGYFMGLLFIRFENIWLVGAFHGIWNFIQTNIFGTRINELGTSSSVFSTSLSEGQEFLHGGLFGIEGGVMASFILLFGIAILTVEMRTKGMFVAAKPVENPYDKAYFESLSRRFGSLNPHEEPHQEQWDRWTEKMKNSSFEQTDGKNIDAMNKDVIVQNRNQEKEEDGQVRQTEFDQNYFKQ